MKPTPAKKPTSHVGSTPRRSRRTRTKYAAYLALAALTACKTGEPSSPSVETLEKNIILRTDQLNRNLNTLRELNRQYEILLRAIEAKGGRTKESSGDRAARENLARRIDDLLQRTHNIVQQVGEDMTSLTEAGGHIENLPESRNFNDEINALEIQIDGINAVVYNENQ